jgi:uncharacterized membrane protein
MQQLHSSINAPTLGWLHHVVPQLLRSAGHVGAAEQAAGCGDAGGHSASPGRTYQGGCFAGGGIGGGCRLSLAEEMIALEVGGEA